MRATSDVKLSCLCSHYKDSYDIHAATIRQRDILFYVLLLVVAIFTLHTSNGEFVNEALGKAINKTTDIQLYSKREILSSFLWFVLFGVSSKYYLLTVTLEKQYGYMHALENEISKSYPRTDCFTREGKFYLNKYPLFSNWLKGLYTLIFPALLMFSIYNKITTELWLSDGPYNVFAFNFMLYLAIGTSTTLCFIYTHKERLITIFTKTRSFVG